MNKNHITTHNLGFPRIGGRRELKFSLEKFWRNQISEDELFAITADLRQKNWQAQRSLDLSPIGDFSLYDQVLDMSTTLGNLPERAVRESQNMLDAYFLAARGQSVHQHEAHHHCGVTAGEMTKWFNTNYHYIVPEFTKDTTFKLNFSRLQAQLQEAREQGIKTKPVIIGPVTYLALGKEKDESYRLDLLPKILPIYKELLASLAAEGADWVQIDEPILVTELEENWRAAFRTAYQSLQTNEIRILLTTYFGKLAENLELLASLPVAGVHIDAVNAREEVAELIQILPADRILSLGVVDGRNTWKTDLGAALKWLQPIADQLGDRLWLAPSCSLLHVPVDLDAEREIDPEVKSWLAFAVQKLEEIRVLSIALSRGEEEVRTELDANAAAIESRKNSSRVSNPTVRRALAEITPEMSERRSPWSVRNELQAPRLNLPLFPTTTIGSWPQTKEIRRARKDFRSGEISSSEYQKFMRQEIGHCIAEQEKLELDVLVHGEPERNDMVEYFGEQLEGYAFTNFGWVQSYGSRCVKPPIIFGDIRRRAAMTIDWICYAQSLTDKVVKGMLTGPVTMLNWSFVRDDQPRALTCQQLALAIREEVLDLEQAGIKIIQIDEAALREGLPLRRSEWQGYLHWAVAAFRLTANGVRDETQIHTHMCYSEFNDIIGDIAKMDADVITIETSRSDMELLKAFDDFNYPNGIGPGVYDIHSPNIPSEQEMIELMEKAALRIPIDRLWVNPDCGLKTRRWKEVIPALTHMVAAAKFLRKKYT